MFCRQRVIVFLRSALNDEWRYIDIARYRDIDMRVMRAKREEVVRCYVREVRDDIVAMLTTLDLCHLPR